MRLRHSRSRRRFLKQAAASAALLTLAAGTGRRAREALAAMSERHHLINIHAKGGWDSHFFHSTIPPFHAQFKEEELLRKQYDSGGSLLRVHHQLFSRRFADEGYMAHPRRPDVFLGLGMKNVFAANPGLLDHMLVWRGMRWEGGHNLGNQMLLHGVLSQYALSFSTMFAMKFAESRLRPLHFVQVSETPGDLNTNWAFARGAGIPVNIPSYQAFQALTRPSANDLVEPSRRDALSAAVTRLTRAIGMAGLQLRSSKSLYQSFIEGFQGALRVGGSNMADSLEFLHIWKSYTLAGMNAIDGLYYPAVRNLMDSEITGHGFVQLDAAKGKSDLEIARTFAAQHGWNIEDLPSWSEVRDAVTPEAQEAMRKRLSDFLTLRRYVGGWYGQAVDNAFPYAMADFLVRNDLSAVVDLGTPCGDNHDFGDTHLLALTLTFAYFRKLLENLKSYPTGTEGKSLLDVTTVVMHTEFDRTAHFELGLQEFRRGTNHGFSASVILAGHGIRGGTVVGDIKGGPGSPYMPAGSSTELFPDFEFSWRLPIDPVTGMPSESGALASIRSLFPTLLSIHGIPVPANQITDAGVFPCILKG